jgi:hypothetical protein
MTKPTAAPTPLPRAHYLDLADDRRAAAEAHVAMLSETVRQVARDLPLSADVDDFRRVLMANAPKVAKS